jgi:hypothetical protein
VIAESSTTSATSEPVASRTKAVRAAGSLLSPCAGVCAILISISRLPSAESGTCNHAEKTKRKQMQLKVSVISDRSDEYVGKKGLVKQQVITCQDIDPSGFRLLMPFDYTLSDEEKTKYAGKLQDKQIVIGVRELVPFGGRLRARGAIVTGPVGKEN